jgi:RecJ-like exonuclease
MKALVSCIRQNGEGGSADYFVVAEGADGIETRKLKSGLVLNVGELVEISVKEGQVESAVRIEGAKEMAAFRKRMEETAKTIPKGKEYKTGIEKVDSVTSALWKRLEDAMMLLSGKLVSASPILVRFHNDVDGLSGAYALHNALLQVRKHGGAVDYEPNVTWRMHGGVSYNREDATTDIMTCNNFESAEKPLLIILDFGTSLDSNPGIELIKERFDIIWLDHHPIIEKFEGVKLRHYMSPWIAGGDSNYTAGFLTCMFARTLTDFDIKDLEEASFIGDYSEFMRPTPESRRIAVLMDLLTSDTRLVAGSRGNLNPGEVREIFEDKKRSDDLISYAENRVSEMLDTAINSVKEYRAKGANIYVADFEDLRGDEESRYPLPGRFASKLLDRIEELNKIPCVLFLHFGYYISVRMSKKLNDKVALLKKLEEVKAYYSGYVESTGGHSNAASIKLKTGEMKKEVIKYAVDKVKESFI